MDATLIYSGRKVILSDVNPSDFIEGMALQGQWYELPNLEFIRALNISGTYVDVGAYVGTFSLFVSLFCPAEKVYAFEPQSLIYKKLCRNLEVNKAPNCVAMNYGLAEERGRGTAGGAPYYNIGGAMLKAGDEVEVAPLDSLNIPNVTVLKVDVEGMEMQVLAGAVKTLETVRHLFVETWKSKTCIERGTDYQRDKLISFLWSRGFLFRKDLTEDLLYFAQLGEKHV
jgi:FkbM family methyltransferase